MPTAWCRLPINSVNTNFTEIPINRINVSYHTRQPGGEYKNLMNNHPVNGMSLSLTIIQWMGISVKRVNYRPKYRGGRGGGGDEWQVLLGGVEKIFQMQIFCYWSRTTMTIKGSVKNKLKKSLNLRRPSAFLIDNRFIADLKDHSF